ncbi:hypothetical protein [Streptomyces sp. NPDC088554]|uniref:hypothetical protein n=1 Tax=Streptomyces sp. NPDC088554 TaxID=3365865 RepID=UPI0037F6BA68
MITDIGEAARDLGMAAFSVLTHSDSREAPALLEAPARALRTTDEKTVSYYGDLVDVGLADLRARQKWRDLMAFVTHFPGRGTLREEAYLEGRAEGQAKMVLRTLDLRSVAVSDEVRARITECADLDVLDTWFNRAFNATEAEDLFVDTDTSATPSSSVNTGK